MFHFFWRIVKLIIFLGIVLAVYLIFFKKG